MNVYLAIKYHPDHANRTRIEQILSTIESAGGKAICIARDVEQWGKLSYPPEELMRITFREIRNMHLVVVDLTEKGVGVGIEAGYAAARGIPILTIAQHGSDISETLKGISSAVRFYTQPAELLPAFREIAAGQLA